MRGWIASKARCFRNAWKIGFARTIRCVRSTVFVGGLDLAELGFGGVDPEANRLYVYGYLNRVQSSRRLEREAGRADEVIE